MSFLPPELESLYRETNAISMSAFASAIGVTIGTVEQYRISGELEMLNVSKKGARRATFRILRSAAVAFYEQRRSQIPLPKVAPEPPDLFDDDGTFTG